jgi:hypothetical protein
VTDHATPVGSGTVARTKRILVEKRAEAAVIAWIRQQTTGYDGMAIPRVKGKRREVRRMLARRSQECWTATAVGRRCRGVPAAAGVGGLLSRNASRMTVGSTSVPPDIGDTTWPSNSSESYSLLI